LICTIGRSVLTASKVGTCAKSSPSPPPKGYFLTLFASELLSHVGDCPLKYFDFLRNLVQDFSNIGILLVKQPYDVKKTAFET
jgi:hypothetical protein